MKGHDMYSLVTDEFNLTVEGLKPGRWMTGDPQPRVEICVTTSLDQATAYLTIEQAEDLIEAIQVQIVAALP
jgi:hypothetical protein